MSVTGDHIVRSGPNPVHGVLLAGTIPLFLGTLLSDIAYWYTHQIQWSNFASWLNVGGLIFAGLALLCALLGLFRSDNRNRDSFVYILVLLATLMLGFINALFHARDAWAMMPGALILSVIVFLLALTATAIGFVCYRQGVLR